MRKVLLWGMGEGYEGLINQIQNEIKKKNMDVVGIICKEEDRYFSNRDGFPVISKLEALKYQADYVLITAWNFVDQIIEDALEIGFRRNQIIDGGVFHLPCFDFARYASLIENPVTILSDNCWGGFVYNRLHLPFSSPLINIRWKTMDFARFIRKPSFYLGTELTMVTDGDIRRGVFPIASLGNDDDHVEMELVHHPSFSAAKEDWERRVGRINYDNLFVKMGFRTDIDLTNEERANCIQSFEMVLHKKIFFCDDEAVDASFQTARFYHQEDAGRYGLLTYDYNR